jgi:adenylate kinase family enzyme
MLPRFIKDDPDELAVFIKDIGQGLIAFDGRPAAGKSPLAREMAKRLTCTAVDVDDFLPKFDDADFAATRNRHFVDMLRIDNLRFTVKAGGPLVLMSGVLARQVVERLQITAATFVWVEWASLLRLDQMIRDFFDYDEGAHLLSKHRLYKEVQTYIDTYDARRRPDVIYMNAYADRN